MKTQRDFEDEVTRYTKVYLTQRDRWLKIILIIFGIVLFFILIFNTYALMEFLDWVSYKHKATLLLDKSNIVMDRYIKITGIMDTVKQDTSGTRKR